MTIKKIETNPATPESIIAALKWANKEKDKLINSLIGDNVKLEKQIAELKNNGL